MTVSSSPSNPGIPSSTANGPWTCCAGWAPDRSSWWRATRRRKRDERPQTALRALRAPPGRAARRGAVAPARASVAPPADDRPRAGGGGARRQPGARAYERGGPEPALALLAGRLALRPQHRPGRALLRARPSRHAGGLERGGAADRRGHHGRAALPGAALSAAAALRPGRPF